MAAASLQGAVGRLVRCLALTMPVLLLTEETQAGTAVSLLAGGWSQHFAIEGDFNQSHRGLGVEVERDFGPLWGGGVVWNFTNSYDERSTYVGATLKRCGGSLQRLRGCLGVTGGAADGYDAIGREGFRPFGGLTSEVSYGRAGMVVVCVPPISADTGGACMVVIKLRNRAVGSPSWSSWGTQVAPSDEDRR